MAMSCNASSLGDDVPAAVPEEAGDVATEIVLFSVLVSCIVDLLVVALGLAIGVSSRLELGLLVSKLLLLRLQGFRDTPRGREADEVGVEVDPTFGTSASVTDLSCPVIDTFLVRFPDPDPPNRLLRLPFRVGGAVVVKEEEEEERPSSADEDDDEAGDESHEEAEERVDEFITVPTTAHHFKNTDSMCGAHATNVAATPHIDASASSAVL